MDESLKSAARNGNVSDLYRLIQRDGNVLRRIDEVEFIETPLHIAAAKGCIAFAMEIMSLKPSFARKLNHEGLSPIHIAVEKGQTKLVLNLMENAKDLVRVKGKNGETPLHYVINKQKPELLPRFLEECPESIRDLTTENQNALHIAVINNNVEALNILCKMLRKTNYCEDVVNQKDRNGDTALHIAALYNQDEKTKSFCRDIKEEWGEASSARSPDLNDHPQGWNSLEADFSLVIDWVIDVDWSHIHEDGNVLKRIDKVEFISTPLHIAAHAGCIDFAMEIMILKPSFARKLNQQGLSPIHIALEKRHKELVLNLMENSKDLVRVKGKKGETPLHYVITREGNPELLPRFLEDCPESIRDLTTENQTALHIAVINNNLEALKILCNMLRKTDYCQDVVNQKDRNDDTVLHIAALYNRREVLLLSLLALQSANIHFRSTRARFLVRCMLVDTMLMLLCFLVQQRFFKNIEMICRSVAIFFSADWYNPLQKRWKCFEVEFIDTPLHIAAAAGCIDFAMEIMSLKLSFARKLNHVGLSPIHISIEKGIQSWC
ncbi:hypothetical protein PTKIN_Ptkin16aG0498900 [Pterospermum kingtungense]